MRILTGKLCVGQSCRRAPAVLVGIRRRLHINVMQKRYVGPFNLSLWMMRSWLRSLGLLHPSHISPGLLHGACACAQEHPPRHLSRTRLLAFVEAAIKTIQIRKWIADFCFYRTHSHVGSAKGGCSQRRGQYERGWSSSVRIAVVFWMEGVWEDVGLDEVRQLRQLKAV